MYANELFKLSNITLINSNVIPSGEHAQEWSIFRITRSALVRGKTAPDRNSAKWRLEA